MNVCYYKYTNSPIYLINNRIKITFNDNKKIIIFLTNCKQYAGIITTVCGCGYLFYLIDSNNNKLYNPLNDIINQNTNEISNIINL